ncbi:C40 family peptidase [Candidatus Gillettellia adelgis]
MVRYIIETAILITKCNQIITKKKTKQNKQNTILLIKLPQAHKIQKSIKTVKVASGAQRKHKCYANSLQSSLSKTKHLYSLKQLHRGLENKKRYQYAKSIIMTKLMRQMGKPYRWGGSSPNIGFDCSGLIYYAYKDVINIKMPRTTKEIYYSHDAFPIKKSKLECGDLVFFRIHKNSVTDHVGVYIGHGKFIQSPRSGKAIHISQLEQKYWKRHYIGARRIVTPQTVR